MEDIERLAKEGYFLPESRASLEFFYETKLGNALLTAVTSPGVSKVAGAFLDSGLSKALIPRFVRKNGINTDECEQREYFSFNDFFTRELNDGARETDTEPSHLISPCDSCLMVFPITDDAVFRIKHFDYSVAKLVGSKKAAEKYSGGYCAIFRLTVGDYHRYCYIDNGTKTENRFIKGVLHTVNPIAYGTEKVYSSNCREVTVLHTENFGDVAEVEVGALLVGKIVNFHGEHTFSRGEEKGMFEYGGSTVVLLFEKGKVRFEEKLLDLSALGYEKKVRMGEHIGDAAEK